MLNEKVKIAILGDAKDAEQAFRQVQDAAETTMAGIGVATSAAMAATAALATDIFQVGMETDRLRAKMEYSGASLDFVATKSELLGLNIRKNADDYGSLTAASKGTELQGEATQKVWLASALASKALNLTTEQSTGMLKAFEQMMSKGNVQAEELRGQLGERLPGAFNMAADAMGVSTQELNKMLGNGEVLASDLLPKLSEKMIKEFTPAAELMAKRGGSAVSRLGNDFFSLRSEVADNGSYLAMTNVLNLLHDEIVDNGSGVKELAGDISDVLITSMQVGTTGAAIFAKGFVAMQMPIDAVRIGIDAVALGGVQAFDVMLAGYEAYMSAVQHIPGAIGKDAKSDLEDVRAFRKEIGYLEEGIKATGNESLKTFLDNSVATEQAWANIDSKAQKVFDALEKGRNAPVDVLAPSSGDGKQGKGNNANTAKATADAQKVIDIHSAKFEKIQALGAVAFEDESTRLLAKNDLELSMLDAEQARMISAAETQGASKEQLDTMGMYYDDLRITRAQETADAIGEIEMADAEARMQRLMDGENAAYNLKGQFQQLTSENQLVNLNAMVSNAQTYAKATQSLDKATGEQKMAFAASTFGALSGLMGSENKKQFEIGKKAARAENAINGFKAAMGAYSSLAPIPIIGPFLGGAAALAVGKMAMANDAKIAGTQMGGGAGTVTMPTISAGGGNGGSTPTTPINPGTGLPQRQSNNQNDRPIVDWNITVISDGSMSPDAEDALADRISKKITDQQENGMGLTA